MLRSLSAMAAVSLAMTLTGPASASVVNVSDTIDLNSLDLKTYGLSSSLAPVDVDIAEGDTYTITVDFLGDQSLTFKTFGGADFFISTGGMMPLAHKETGYLEFLGKSGQTIYKTTPEEQYWGEGAVGSFLHPQGVPKLYFWGARYTGTLHQYFPAGQTSYHFTAPSFTIGARGLGLAAPVSEPSEWGLMLLGLASAGAVVRSRRSPWWTRCFGKPQHSQPALLD